MPVSCHTIIELFDVSFLKLYGDWQVFDSHKLQEMK